MPDEVTKKIGQFELRKVLGRGGMATVWRAYQPSLDRDVAIKVMAAQFSEDESFAKRFNQEARSIARLRHPNILAVYEYGQDNGQPYIVTEMLDGGTLREFMASRQMDLRQMSRIIHQIADALDYAHEQGMVHRDIKPSNILMGTQRVFGDRAVLADFGIVKLLSQTNITQTGVGVGTPEYMSPEQAAGEPLDGRSDQYSLGIVLYEMLTGVTPFKADTPLAVLMGHVNRPLPDPRTFNPNITEEIVAVISRALAKYPHERFRLVGEFAEAFRQTVEASLPLTGATASGSETFTGQPRPGTGELRPPGTPDPGTPPRPPTYSQPVSGFRRPGTGDLMISSAQAYDYAMMQQRQGNLQAAFETLTDIFRREPNYRDVAAKLKEFETKHFQYTGQHTVYRASQAFGAEGHTQSLENQNQSTRIGAYVPKDPTEQGSYVPPTSPTPATATGQPVLTATPPGPAASARKAGGLMIGAGIAAALLVLGAIAAFVILPGSNRAATTTPQAVVSATAATTTTPATSVGATTAAITAATTAPATTVAATPTPTEKPDPVAGQVRQVVADIYKQDGNLKDGIARLKDIATANKTSWLAQRELGRAYYWYVRDKGGIPYLLEAIRLNPDDAISHAYLGIAYFDTFNDASALTAVSQAQKLDANSAEVKAAVAITLLRSAPTRARDEALAAVKMAPDNILANWAAWSGYTINRETGTALNYLNKLTSRYTKFANFIYGKGYQYQLDGDLNQAKTWFQNALVIDPDFPLAHTALGEIARFDGKFDNAIKEYRQAISVYENDPNAYTGLGFALIAKNQFAEADTEFKKALQIDARNAVAYNGRAITYISRAAAPENSNSPQVVTSFLTEAVAQAEQALKLDTAYADAYFQKGYALYLLKRNTEAEEPLRKATELVTNNVDYLVILAYNFAGQKKNDEAKKAAQAALGLDPNQQQAKDLIKKLGG